MTNSNRKIIAKSSINRTLLHLFKIALIISGLVIVYYEFPEKFLLFGIISTILITGLNLIPRESTIILEKDDLVIIKHSYFMLRKKISRYALHQIKSIEFSGRKPAFPNGIGLHNLALEVFLPSLGSKIKIEMKDDTLHEFPCFAEKKSLKKIVGLMQ